VSVGCAQLLGGLYSGGIVGVMVTVLDADILFDLEYTQHETDKVQFEF